MTDRFPPINPRFPHMLYGGDYNPDQWLHSPETLQEDLRLMQLAGINSATLGVFAWSSYEKREGQFNFDWLDRVMDNMAERKMAAVLATPSGARPAWLSKKYPEVLRVNQQGIRDYHQMRHNHCPTSPAYREKVGIINRKLAERYHNHPALAVWHLSNEYSGECFCELCKNAFRQWLRERYKTLDALNLAWWSAFWSHTVSDWDEIEPVDASVGGMVIDWKRFVTAQTVDFMKAELAALRQFSKDVPAATNFMGTYPGLDYWKLAEHLDVVSWDSYPRYHSQSDMWKTGADVAFNHDMNRSMKGGRPFMLMESVPSATNWAAVPKLKRPGVLRLEMIQAIAHGSDTCQFFQFRKSRGAHEKFHGAVVDHAGHENTRVFRDVAEVGSILGELDDVVGTRVDAEVALVQDWENRWALEASCGPRQQKDYMPTCYAHYRPFWSMGVPVDVINADCDFSKYKVLIAPMLYMIRPGVGERIASFVESGGTLVATYLTGIANESDLCFTGGWPGAGLRKVLGIWSEEIDSLYDEERVRLSVQPGNSLGLEGQFNVQEYADLVHAEGAEVLATYGSEFYAGRPAITCNSFGKGKAYYLAGRTGEDFLKAFYCRLVGSAGVSRNVGAELPEGLTVQCRRGGGKEFLFVLNFADQDHQLPVAEGRFIDVLSGGEVSHTLRVTAYGAFILQRC